MKRRLGIAVMMMALVALLLVVVPLAAPAAPSLNSYEQQLVSLINQQRAQRGLAKLRVNTKLISSAREHSTDMSVNQYFQHDSLNGERWASRIVRCGYKRSGYGYWKAGENIYYGAGLFGSPCAVVDAWLASKPHRQVLLTKVFRDIGVGAVECDSGFGDCAGSVWFFTLDLGRRIAK